ncbi:hypothetical protein VZ95_06100 [Elstera litoralis]|uniref:Sec-independent protein translocase protein TatA n=1 Tax=Elstera litoralis TaxID=552518 RepID=A0A0F3IXE6_9PROT|nr:twin-arginine translocase TatA/TatE family subunit [Elstera litoralis]KJV10264.1 hypothetical protein VZ95_06100 [Elstera litoralis]
MGSFSIWHWLLVAVVIILLFGAKKVPSAMGDLAKGIKAFKRGLNDDSDATQAAAATPAPQAPVAGTVVPPAAPAAAVQTDQKVS